MDMTFILIAIIFSIILVGLVFALGGPNPEKVVLKRLAALRDRLSPSNEAALAAQMRRTIAARIPGKENGLAQMIPNPERMALRLRQTGKKWTLSNYLAICCAIALLLTGAGLLQGMPTLLAILIGLGAGFGIPHMVIGNLIGKRIKKFNTRFPDAIDLLVRGLRSGLPIAETIQAVSTEIPGIGKTMEAALQETADTLGTPEFQFFCITLAIQRETGGNLAETLANLSEVLRKRAQMKLKIAAMSSEAKASAWIVGSLPFLVFTLVYVMNPDYLAAFFPWSGELYDERVMYTGLGGLVWMGMGVGIMAKMVNFEI
jgi:tight adherence protein B